MCLQETKLKDSDVEACEKILKPTLPGYHFYWNNSIARKGYSGTAIISRCAEPLHMPVTADNFAILDGKICFTAENSTRTGACPKAQFNCLTSRLHSPMCEIKLPCREEPLSVSMGLDIEEHDQEGRVITAEFPDFYGAVLSCPPALTHAGRCTPALQRCCCLRQAAGRRHEATVLRNSGNRLRSEEADTTTCSCLVCSRKRIRAKRWGGPKTPGVPPDRLGHIVLGAPGQAWRAEASHPGRRPELRASAY